MQKVFYCDHYYVEILYIFTEELDNEFRPVTTLLLQTNLKFVKNVQLIQKKIKEYYDGSMIASFNTYLKPRLE